MQNQQQRREFMKTAGAAAVLAGATGVTSAASAAEQQDEKQDERESLENFLAEFEWQDTKDQWAKLDAMLISQADGVKCYVESDIAPLRACLVGNSNEIWMPDPEAPSIKNMIKGNASDKFLAYLNKHKGKNLHESDPEYAAILKAESDGLAKAYRDNGVKVIRNETGSTPQEITNMSLGWSYNRQLSTFGQAAFEVMGHCLVSCWEPDLSWGMELVHRAAINHIMRNDPKGVFLSMPAPQPNRNLHINPPFLSAGDFIIMPDKHVLIGLGVYDPADINDPTKTRSSGDEWGAEVLRRMLAPHGWTVDVFYFDRNLTYHADALMAPLAEGLISYPKDSLFTPLPAPFDQWEVFETPMEDFKNGANNLEVLGEKKVLLTSGAKALIDFLDSRGFEVVPVDYDETYKTFGSGIHCSTASIWREA